MMPRFGKLFRTQKQSDAVARSSAGAPINAPGPIARPSPTASPPQTNTATVSQATKSTTLWERAINALSTSEEWHSYCKIINHDPQNQSNSTTADDVLTSVQAVLSKVQDSQISFQLGGKAIVVRDVCNKVVSAINAAKDVGTAVASLNPYASLAWSGLQFFLQTIATAKELRDMCWDVLPRVTYLISRYQTMEELYVGEQNLVKMRMPFEQALVDLYVLVVKYQMEMVIFMNQRLKRVKTSFFKASDSNLQALWNDIEKKEKGLESLQVTAAREIDSAYLLDLTQSNATLRRVLNQTWDELHDISRIVHEQERRKILEWISNVKYVNMHNAERRVALANTGKWLLNHSTYCDWLSQTGSQSIWLNGFMGSGKSCLSHLVVENLLHYVDASYGQRLAFFYIDGVEARASLDYVITILRCLLKQLVDSGPSKQVLAVVQDMYKSCIGKADLDFQKTLHLLHRVMSLNKTTFIVVDGLDECLSADQRRLTSALSQLLNGVTSEVKLFFASRPTQSIENSLACLRTETITIRQHNKKDISDLIVERIRQSTRDPGLVHLYKRGNDDQSIAAANVLRQNAQGMFRWVQMAVDYLNSSADFWTLQERLRTLPRLQSLFDLYDEMYDTTIKSLGPRSVTALRLVLTLMLHADDTSAYVAISYAANAGRILGNVQAFTTERGLGILVSAMLANVFDSREPIPGVDVTNLHSSFISKADEGSLAFHFPHFSVREYLLDRHDSEYGPYVGHRSLLKRCLRSIVLQESVNVPYNYVSLILNAYFAFAWPHHLEGMRTALKTKECSSKCTPFDDTEVKDLLRDFLLAAPASQSFIRWHYNAMAVVRRADVSYSQGSVIPCLLTDPPSSIMSRIFFGVGLEDDQFPRGLLDVDTNTISSITPWKLPRLNPLQLATALGDIIAIRWLANQGVCMNYVNNDKESVMQFAIQPSLVIHNHDRFPDPWKKDPKDRVEIIRTLIQYGTQPRMPGADENGMTTRYWKSDLYAALLSRGPQDITIALFEDGARRADAAIDWYVFALWFSVYYQLPFQDWLRERYDQFVPRDATVFVDGLPTCKYIEFHRIWIRSDKSERVAFTRVLANASASSFEAFVTRYGIDLET